MSISAHEHYRRLLLLPEPWEVTKVEEDILGLNVTVWLRWPDGAKVPCPVCGQLMPIYDRMKERSWRHRDVMQYRLELRCAVPRCDCEEHGVKTMHVPWAEPGSRFTSLFESFAVAVIASSRSLSQAAELLGLHWDSVQRIIDQAVERGLARRNLDGITRVGLDEKSFLRGQSYVSLMTDLTGRRVLDVVPGRDTGSGLKLWASLSKEQIDGIEAVAMDMGASFIAATHQAAPNADIVHDRFHVSKPMNEAVDHTRRDEAAELAAKGDDILKRTRFLWLHGIVPDDRKEHFEALLESNLRTAKAWAYKEQLVEFWGQPNADAGNTFFQLWYRSVMSSRLPRVKKVAKSLKAHLAGLLTYFKHRISNALTEGFNSKIQAIKADARGFRKFENYRTRILFFCGKLDLEPNFPPALTHSIP
ncbi:MAG: ISL3 family transposase [Opitutus sp.]|nr:ISL3 family transposase [Opitutus sp.]MCS6242753.1 ISL3 family transposase [Opitutus sp.]MCS6242763.1 ISL3 family transposase [Opitutus sp.]MCS6242764.1 ISL3 family transposase [Opitutus sp.]MCS6242766.1 ISL3 family transposase [Opitutus sp.]